MNLEALLVTVESFVGRPIHPEEALIESGIIDSVTLVELIRALEEQFEIAIGLDDLNPEHFATAHTLFGFISQKVKAS